MDLQECPGDCNRLNMHAVFSKKTNMCLQRGYSRCVPASSRSVTLLLSIGQ